MRQFANLSSGFNNPLSQFASVVTDIKPITKPSILAVGGHQQINLRKLRPENIEQLLLVHPIVPRGIEIRANRMTSRGYMISPKNKSQRAKKAAREMVELLDNSGGIDLLNKWIQNADAFGDGYLTLVPNNADNKIVLLNLEHPVFFRIARETKKESKQKDPNLKLDNFEDVDYFDYEYGAMKIDPDTKKPSKYTQVRYADQSRIRLVMEGKEIDADQVAHLIFDTWGDEVQGISKLQYIHPIITYLLNINEAAAEATFRAGFTQKKITTEIMNERELKEIAKNLKGINAKDAVILPRGVDMENLIPGQTQYPQIHDVLLTQLAIRLGIPKPILALDGTSTNKATMEELTKDMMKDLRADELKVKQAIETQIFIPACKKMFGDNFADYPTFDFNPFQESKDSQAARHFRISQTLQSTANAASILIDKGYIDRADQVLRFIDEIIPPSEEHGVKKEQKNEPERRIKTVSDSTKPVENPNSVGRPDGSNTNNVRGKTPPSIEPPENKQ